MIAASLPEASAGAGEAHLKVVSEPPPPGAVGTRRRRPAAAELESWGLIRRLQVPGRGRVEVLAFVIDRVPLGTKQAAVMGALEANGLGAKFGEGGHAFANYVLRPESRWPAKLERSAAVLRGSAEVHRTWESLTELEERRITLSVPPTLWARLTLAAELEGLPLAGYIRRVLEEASGA